MTQTDVNSFKPPLEAGEYDLEISSSIRIQSHFVNQSSRRYKEHS